MSDKKQWRRNTLSTKPGTRHEESRWTDTSFGDESARRDLPPIKPPAGWKPSVDDINGDDTAMIKLLVISVALICVIVAVAFWGVL
jgi:hypothetical protein